MPNLNDVMEMAELLKSRSVVAIEDHCVAVRNRNSSCRRCADVCIADAVSIALNSITIDAGACVGCGACIGVCPTGALVSLDPMEEDLAVDIAKAIKQAEGMAVFGCARIAARDLADPEKFAVVPCLGRMDEALLVSLASHGVDDIVLVDGTCATCKYGKVSAAVDDTVETAIRLLEMQGSQAIITRFSEFPAEVLAEDERKVIGAARRDFFTHAGGYAKSAAMTAAEKTIADKLHQDQQRKMITLKDRLGAGKSGKMPTFEPEKNMLILDALYELGEPAESVIDTRLFGSVSIDASACSGCGMCVMFCPTAALKHSTLEQPADEEHRYLEFQAADCTQCALCVDVCLRHCITLSSEVGTDELFGFDPRLIEIPKPAKANNLFSRSRRTK